MPESPFADERGTLLEELALNTLLSDIRQTLVPNRTSRDGPLPPLLVGLTFVTGLVDAFSYLVLGHVFVANMTGNVAFLGFAVVGAPGFSIGASAVALASFWVGAVAGGRVGWTYRSERARLLSVAAAIQGALLAVSLILAVVSDSPITSGYRYALIVVLGMAMGIQNAAARKLAVADLTTTVLTQTITGLAADSAIAGGKGSKAGRRLTSVAAMLIGALVGAALVLHAHVAYTLAIAVTVLVVIGVTSWRLGRSDPAWVGVEPAAR
jgi:uncharacterized membrane protein YoaK (UPF0700 family)